MLRTNDPVRCAHLTHVPFLQLPARESGVVLLLTLKVSHLIERREWCALCAAATAIVLIVLRIITFCAGDFVCGSGHYS